MKNRILHTVIWKEDRLFVAKFLELELASQGKTKEEALKNLKEAFDLFIEEENIGNLQFPSIEKVATQTISLS